MKKSILIGLISAITASSAYAYTVTAQKNTKTFGGAPNTTYYIKCNNGLSKTVVSNPGWTTTTFIISDNGRQFTSMDQAAKSTCGE